MHICVLIYIRTWSERARERISLFLPAFLKQHPILLVTQETSHCSLQQVWSLPGIFRWLGWPRDPVAGDDYCSTWEMVMKLNGAPEHWLKMAILHFVRTDWPLGELRNFIGCMPVWNCDVAYFHVRFPGTSRHLSGVCRRSWHPTLSGFMRPSDGIGILFVLHLSWAATDMFPEIQDKHP